MNENEARSLQEWYGLIPETEPRIAAMQDRYLRTRRIAGVLFLAIAALGAAALLIFGGSLLHREPREPQSMEEFFDGYYDTAENAAWSADMPTAQYGLGVEVPAVPVGDEVLTLGELYGKCAKSVVAITTETGGSGGRWGSGIIFTEDGYILTNTHVLDEARSAVVTLWDDREYEALLVGADSATDIAVLKIDASGLPAAELCESLPAVGEEVAAIGNPLGRELRGTLTEGIISGLSRDVSYTSHPMTLIQTSAAINSGSSGGALFNMHGQVVGMTSMKMVSRYSGSNIEGIGFAIPVETMREIGGQLLANGEVLGRAALGITVGAIPAEARERFGLPEGLYVSVVAENSDAAAKGVREGDVLTSVNGASVTTTAELSELLDGLGVGESVTLGLYRDGESLSAEVRIMDFADIY